LTDIRPQVSVELGMLTLRAATPADTHAIADLWHQGWIDGHLGHVPEALLPHRHFDSFLGRVPERIGGTTVALLESRLVGFATVLRDELEQLYVAPSARGGGAAVALFRNAEAVIAEDFALAWLAVVVGNARARRFYEREGWTDAGRFDYSAQIEGGTIAVPCHRYEKRLTR
jgi:GNAT superfamily N-acetyltransferase